MFSFLNSSSSNNKKEQASSSSKSKSASSPILSNAKITKTKSTNPAVNAFFARVTTMLDNYVDVLMERADTINNSKVIISNNNNNTSSSSTTMGKVECYAMLSECGYQGQVEALQMLYEWFAIFVRDELHASILSELQKNQSNSSSTSSSSSSRNLMKKIASFLSAFSRLVLFARICYLALEQPQFLGKYFALGGAGFTSQHQSPGQLLYQNNDDEKSDNNNKNTKKNTTSYLQQIQQQRTFLMKSSSGGGNRNNNSSTDDSFIVKSLKGMLKDVASNSLRPFILEHLPKILRQTRIAKQKKAILRSKNSNSSSSGENQPNDENSWVSTFQAILSASSSASVENKNQKSSSSTEETTAITSIDDEKEIEHDLVLFANVVGFFRNLTSSSSSSSTGNPQITSTEEEEEQEDGVSSFASSAFKLEETIFRQEFFDSYLDSLREQFAFLATEMMKKASETWATECYFYLNALLSCEKEISQILFNNNNNNIKRSGSAHNNNNHLVVECVRAARSSFITVCALPLIQHEKYGIRALLAASNFQKVSLLVSFVSTEASVLPHMKTALEEGIKKQLMDYLAVYNDTIDAIHDQSDENTDDQKKKNKTPPEIHQELNAARTSFVKNLLSYIHLWNDTIVNCFSSNNSNSTTDSIHLVSSATDSTLLKILLEKVRRNAFREVLNSIGLKGAKFPTSSSSTTNFRTSSTQHIAETVSMYCDGLLRGELKGDSLSLSSISSSSSNHHQAQSSSNNTNNTDNGSDNFLIDIVFELVTQLVSFFKDKDLVIELHRAKTAKRLLEQVQKSSSSSTTSSSSSQQQQQNLDLECILAHKLSRVVDMSQTRKFEGMFADVERLPEEDNDFQKYLVVTLSAAAAATDNDESSSKSNNNNCNFKCAVLTSSKWPAFRSINAQSCPVNFSAFPSLHQNVFHFEQFYKKQHQSRKLTWLLDPCTAVMSVHFPKGVKEISMNWVQAFVLCCVDELSTSSGSAAKTNTSTTFENILSFCTGVEQNNNNDNNDASLSTLQFMAHEVRNAIASLALNPRYQILRKRQSSSQTPSSSSEYEVNPDFSLRIKKFHLPKASSAPTTSSSSSDNNKNNLDTGANYNNNNQQPPELPKEILAQRDQVLDACIVRLMKSRQKLKLSEISSLVTASIKAFPVTFKQIKRRIEGLIEREFMERNDDDNNSEGLHGGEDCVFSYVA